MVVNWRGYFEKWTDEGMVFGLGKDLGGEAKEVVKVVCSCILWRIRTRISVRPEVVVSGAGDVAMPLLKAESWGLEARGSGRWRFEGSRCRLFMRRIIRWV